MRIPRIIHQMWEGKDGKAPPEIILEMSETWKTFHPEWQYKFWDGIRINKFIDDYPAFKVLYDSYKYDVQRWDALRYLILFHFGGVYVDLDYECLEPIDRLIGDYKYCIGSEPKRHSELLGLDFYIGNSFMAAMPGNHFFKSVLDHLSTVKSDAKDKVRFVLETTGPLMLTNFLIEYPDRKDIHIIPSKYVAPLDLMDVKQLAMGQNHKELEQKIQEAYCIHYFFGTWIKNS